MRRCIHAAREPSQARTPRHGRRQSRASGLELMVEHAMRVLQGSVYVMHGWLVRTGAVWLKGAMLELYAGGYKDRTAVTTGQQKRQSRRQGKQAR